MQKKTHRNKVRRPNKACSVVLEKQIGPVNRLSILQMVSAEPPAAARKKKTAANHLAAKCPYVCCNMALEGSLQDLAANRHNERACRKEAAKTTFGVALKKTQLSMCFFGCCRGRQSKMLSAWMQLPKRQHMGNLTGKVQWLNMEDLWAALDQSTRSAPGLGLLWSQGLQTRFPRQRGNEMLGKAPGSAALA